MGHEAILLPDALDDLRRDVDLSTPPNDGDVLTFDDASDKWKPGPPGGGGGGVTNLEGLSDVDLTTPADGDVFQYDLASSQWVNRTIAAAGIATVAALTAHIADAAAHAVATTSTNGFMSAADKSLVANLPFRSVKASPYNADSTGASNAATAINTAITDAEAAGGGVVMLPEGTYRVDSQIVCKSNVVLRGHPGGTKIIRGATFTAEFSATVECQAKSNVGFEGITVDGNRAAWAGFTDTSGGGEHRHGLRVVESDRVWVSRCKFFDNKGDGYYIGATTSVLRTTNVHAEFTISDANNRTGLSITDLENGYFANCQFTNHTGGALPKCGVDIEPNNTANVATNITFERCLFAGNGGQGFEGVIGTTTTGKQEGWQLIACTFRNNVATGVFLEQCKAVTFLGCHIYSNGTVGMYVSNQCHHVHVIGGRIYLNGEQGIFVTCNASKFNTGLRIINVAVQNNSTLVTNTKDGIRIDWSPGAASGCVGALIANCLVNNDASVGTTQRFGITTNGATQMVNTIIAFNNVSPNATGGSVLSDQSTTRVVVGNTGIADQHVNAATFLGNVTLSGTGTQSVAGDLSLITVGKRLLLPAGTTNADGIRFGTDTFLYRTGANALKTDGALAVGGQLTVTGSSGVAAAFGGLRLTNVGTATAGTDAVNKDFVEALFGGLDPKANVRVATAAALPANSRTGNVLTASANGVLANVDGVTLIVGDRLLVKNEATGANNGIYTVTSVGSAGTPWTMTRATDADVDAEVTSGMYTIATAGTAASGGWFLSTADPISVNTTALTFAPLATGGGGGSGTVTNVAMTVPGELSVAGSPVTTTGTLAVTWANASGNKFIASPANGTSGAYVGRAIDVLDIPDLAQSKITNLTADLAAKASIAYVDAEIGTHTHDYSAIDTSGLNNTAVPFIDGGNLATNPNLNFDDATSTLFNVNFTATGFVDTPDLRRPGGTLIIGGGTTTNIDFNAKNLTNIAALTVTGAATSGSVSTGAVTATSITSDISVQKVDVRKNSAGTVFSRRRINLIEGTGVTLTFSDDAGNNEIDITIDAAGGGGSPGGADSLIQYNNGGAFGGFGTYNDATNAVTLPGAVTAAGVVNDSAGFLRPFNFERFSYFVVSGTASYNQIGELLTNAGTATFIAATTTSSQMVNHASAATNNSECGFSGGANYVVGRGIRGQFSGQHQETVTQRFWCGFTTNTAAVQAASDTPAGHYACFRYSTNVGGETTYKCLTDDGGSSPTVTDSGVTVTTATQRKFEIVFDDSVPNVKFYIDGVLKATHTTNLPATNQLMRPLFYTRTLAAVAKNLRGAWGYFRVDK